MAVSSLKVGTTTALQDNTSSALATGNGVAAATNNLLNQTNLDPFASFALTTGFAAAPSAMAQIQLYLVPALDGTNFADINTAAPNPDHYVGSFLVEKSQTGSQILTLQGVRLRPFKCKAYLYNNTGQSMSAGWTLAAYGESAQVV